MTNGSERAEQHRALRLGMVGGGIGSLIGGCHRFAARLDDSFDLVAGAFSSDAERSRVSAAMLGIDPSRAYGDWREMVEREEQLAPEARIDAVAIVTPNHLHCVQAQAFLDKGFHVVCDKPMASRLEDAVALAETVRRTGRIFVLTHNYSGYPLTRHAREMVRSGELGDLRVIQAEYAQDWLGRPIELEGQKQAAWRVDPAQAGPGGALGDIGTHAFQLASFITGLRANSLCADLSSFVDGRRLDDNAHVLLRYPDKVRGMLWASQVAAGNENALRIRIYGSRAGLEWAQEEPNQLVFTPLGEPARIITRGSAAVGADGAYATRLPPGHPEGWIEGFAQLYRDAAELIRARIEGRAPDPRACLLPTVEDGEDGMRFITAAVASHARGGSWVRLCDV